MYIISEHTLDTIIIIICSLWPHMPREHLRSAAPYVKELCKKWNIKYNYKPAWEAFGLVITSVPRFLHKACIYFM